MMVNTMYIQLRAIRRPKRRNLIKLEIFIFLLIIFLVASTIFGSIRIDPILYDIAEPAAINELNDTVNAAYSKFVGNTDISYNSLVSITRNQNGQITSVTTNAELLNLMCLQINDDVSAKLKNKNIRVKIPLGTLTGTDILSGKGPSFSVSLSQSNTVDTYTESVFREAGVNQTEHTLLFYVKATMTMVFPNSSVTYDYTQSFVIAQSVIVGDVPSYYTWK